MDVVLSISAWYNFLVSRLLLDAVFLPFAILLGFAVVNRKEYKNRKALCFLVIVCAMILVSRYAVFIRLKTGINTRYLHMLGFYTAILCVPGIPQATRFLQRFGGKYCCISERYLVLLLTAIVGAICVGKALNPPNVKSHIQDTISIIKESNSVGKPILISDCEDAQRVTWYTMAELRPLSFAIGKTYVLRSRVLQKEVDENRQIFLLIYGTHEEFKGQFRRRKAAFPEQLMLVRAFEAKRGKSYVLYKYEKK